MAYATSNENFIMIMMLLDFFIFGILKNQDAIFWKHLAHY
jgi:hypothetical protein